MFVVFNYLINTHLFEASLEDLKVLNVLMLQVGLELDALQRHGVEE